jgi:HD-GYP domain-containing protein (c-di-GMP phosphodiesterase class II)
MADQTNHIQEEMIYNFAEVTENKSGQTGKHVRRVAEYTKILAGAMGYSEHDADEIALASTMHDIGKLMIPSQILDKPGKLTDEEYAVIKTHTTYGGKLLDHVEGEIMTMGRTIALEHHERCDGKGYPKGLKDGEISPYGKIVAVADVYDALTSRRNK